MYIYIYIIYVYDNILGPRARCGPGRDPGRVGHISLCKVTLFHHRCAQNTYFITTVTQNTYFTTAVAQGTYSTTAVAQNTYFTTTAAQNTFIYIYKYTYIYIYMSLLVLLMPLLPFLYMHRQRFVKSWPKRPGLCTACLIQGTHDNGTKCRYINRCI